VSKKDRGLISWLWLELRQEAQLLLWYRSRSYCEPRIRYN